MSVTTHEVLVFLNKQSNTTDINYQTLRKLSVSLSTYFSKIAVELKDIVIEIYSIQYLQNSSHCTILCEINGEKLKIFTPRNTVTKVKV